LLTLTPGTANTLLTVPEMSVPMLISWLEGSTKPTAPIWGAGKACGTGALRIGTARDGVNQGSMAARSWFLLPMETVAPSPASAATVPRP
jgi:hypothetical protein